MGDHFALLVDRLLTESTLGAAIEGRTRLEEVEEARNDCSSHEIFIQDEAYPRKMVECRICQDEDLDFSMETPCSCRGTLKYAHRRCVQRWCNEKGDTICEICHQQFKPGYSAPSPLFQFGGIPMNFRGRWDISRGDLSNPHLVTMVYMNSNNLGINEEDDDDYSASASRSLTCCRLVAIVFMCLLILRHALPILLNLSSYSFPFLLLLLLRTFGILLPIYIMVRAITTIHRRRQQRHQDRIRENIYSSAVVEQAAFPHRPQIIQVG